MASTEPAAITLEPISRLGRAHFQVLYSAPGSGAEASAATEIATLDLNRQLTFADGQTYAIVRRGRVFSTDRELWRGAEPSPVERPLATSLRERVGFLRWRNVVIVGPEPETRYLLRRRKRYGSPANVDVVPLGPEPRSQSEGPIVLRVERVRGWRLRLQAQLLDPAALSLPVAIFVMNVLVVQEQAAAAAAASSGAAGGFAFAL